MLTENHTKHTSTHSASPQRFQPWWVFLQKTLAQWAMYYVRDHFPDSGKKHKSPIHIHTHTYNPNHHILHQIQKYISRMPKPFSIHAEFSGIRQSNKIRRIQWNSYGVPVFAIHWNSGAPKFLYGSMPANLYRTLPLWTIWGQQRKNIMPKREWGVLGTLVVVKYFGSEVNIGLWVQGVL